MSGQLKFPLTVPLLLTLLGALQSPTKLLISGSSASMRDVTESCPYSRFCTHASNLSITDPSLQSCCLPCSCSAQCGSVDRCCPDVEHTAVPTKMYPCRGVEHILRSYLNNDRWRVGETQHYAVIDGCPEKDITSAEMNDSVDRCYTSHNEVEDIVFVTGSLSGLTYLNKHCAVCNNEFIYTEWNIYATHLTLLESVTSLEERDRRILETGGIMLIPPSQEAGLGSICSYREIKTCNFTRMWDYYDREIEMKCKTMTVDYISEFPSGRHEWFANIYCFLCNSPKGTVAPLLCTPIKLDGYDTDVGGRSTSLSALINPAPLASSSDKDSDCSDGDVLDPFRMTCTTLLCPIGSFARNGQCIPFVSELVGLRYRLTILVKFDVFVNRTELNFFHVKDDLSQLVIAKKCGTRDSTLYLDSQTGNAVMDSTLYTKFRCNVTYMLSGVFRLFTSTTVHAFLPRSNLSVTLVNVKRGSAHFTDMDLHVVVAAVDQQVGKHKAIDFFTEETIHCPSILLTRDNVQEFMNDKIASQIVSSAVVVGNETVRVCVSEYMSVFKNTRGTGKAGTMQPNALVVYMSILIALLKM